MFAAMRERSLRYSGPVGTAVAIALLACGAPHTAQEPAEPTTDETLSGSTAGVIPPSNPGPATPPHVGEPAPTPDRDGQAGMAGAGGGLTDEGGDSPDQSAAMASADQLEADEVGGAAQPDDSAGQPTQGTPGDPPAQAGRSDADPATQAGGNGADASPAADADMEPPSGAPDPTAQCVFPLPCPDAPPAPGSLFEDFSPLPENPPECPIAAPENPWGPCVGYPVYIACGYTNGTQIYNCICDWVHWICI